MEKEIKKIEIVLVETNRKITIRYIIVEECFDVEKKAKEIRKFGHKINLFLVNQGENWCHIVSLAKSLNHFINKISQRLAWKENNIFCFYAYKNAKEIEEDLKKEEY